MNTVELQGKIVSIYNGKNVSIVTLFVRNRDSVNLPQIVFTKKDRPMLFDFQEQEFVNIQGSMRTRGVEDADGKSHFEQYIRGMSIEKVGSLINLGLTLAELTNLRMRCFWRALS